MVSASSRSMHDSQSYLNLVKASSWKTKKRKTETFEVSYDEESSSDRESQSSTGSSFHSIASVMVQEFKNQCHGVVDEQSIVEMENRQGEKRWRIDHEEEEGVRKTENSAMLQEFKNQNRELVDENRIVEMENSLVKKQNGAKTLPVDHGEKRVLKRESLHDNYLAPEERKKKTNNVGNEDPSPLMPEEFRNRILELFGENSIVREEFIMQKEVEETDCRVIGERLSIPNGELLEQFLEEDEIKVTPRDVKIIEPGLELGEVHLSSWKIEGKQVYVLDGKWGEVRGRNSIVPGLIVQLFGVRLGNCLKNLLFVLVDITPADLKAKLIMEARNGDRGSSNT